MSGALGRVGGQRSAIENASPAEVVAHNFDVHGRMVEARLSAPRTELADVTADRS